LIQKFLETPRTSQRGHKHDLVPEKLVGHVTSVPIDVAEFVMMRKFLGTGRDLIQDFLVRLIRPVKGDVIGSTKRGEGFAKGSGRKLPVVPAVRRAKENDIQIPTKATVLEPVGQQKQIRVVSFQEFTRSLNSV
jgi:hypothetical protein